MIDMTNSRNRSRDLMREPITPHEFPPEVRLESGMVLARLEKATDRRPEKRKVIVLVRTVVKRRPVSIFDPDPNRPMQDVTEWLAVRMAGGTYDEGSLIQAGTFLAHRERVLKRMYRYVGYLGDIHGPIDWDSFR